MKERVDNENGQLTWNVTRILIFNGVKIRINSRGVLRNIIIRNNIETKCKTNNVFPRAKRDLYEKSNGF